MVGSLWIGVSGLDAQQKALENESNNIANVDTVGFKSARTNFSDQLYSSSGVGHGVSVENFQKNFKQGSIKTTERQYDMSLQGDGFFTIKPESTGDDRTYTRAGNFDINAEGFLTTQEGSHVMGWTSVTTKDIGGSTTNTDAKFTEDYEFLVYNHTKRDADANNIVSTITRRTPYSNSATSAQKTDADRSLNHYSEAPHGGVGTIPVSVSANTAYSISVDGTNRTYTTTVSETTQEALYAGMKAVLNTAGYAVGDMFSDGSFSIKDNADVNQDVAVANGTSGTALVGVDAYENAVTQVEAASAKLLQTNTTVENSGTVLGSLDLDLSRMNISDDPLGEFSVNENGEISIRQGGADVIVGQLAIAKFISNSGLAPIGDNLFRKTMDSGDAMYATNNSKVGTIQGKALEVSNVDLGESLINMIIHQRAFEANAKTITTSDELLTTLLGIKR